MGELESRRLHMHTVNFREYDRKSNSRLISDVVAREFTVAWARTLAGSSPSIWTRGRTSSCRACFGGEIQGQTSWLRFAKAWGFANVDRYWESKLAPGHVPSESYVGARYNV